MRQLREVAGQQGAKGYLFGANRQVAGLLIQMGDLPQAEGYLRKNAVAIQEARTSGHPAWRSSYAKYGQSWESEIEFGRAFLAEVRGQYAEAEAAYRSAEQRRRAAMKPMLEADNPPPESILLLGIDYTILKQAQVKARQGRLAEAEVDARRALLSRLKDAGKYHPQTPRYIAALGSILVEEGRYQEAEKLMRVALDINENAGHRAGSAIHRGSDGAARGRAEPAAQARGCLRHVRPYRQGDREVGPGAAADLRAEPRAHSVAL